MKQKNGIAAEEAFELIESDETELMELIARADAVRRSVFGDEVEVCAIVNAKSGNCGEDCAFCPQSKHSASVINEYPLLPEEEIIESAKIAERFGSASFGIVTSGRSVQTKAERKTIKKAVRRLAEETRFPPCASLGLADRTFLEELKKAGLKRYHHNLEAAESFYGEICTTRSFQDNLKTVEAAKLAGLKVCCGCLFGLGETHAQRVELMDALKSLEVDSVPINFLNPLDGTPIKKSARGMSPIECIKVIAVARLMMPFVTIRVCGGREYNLRDMQSWIFAAGANGVMIGSYLTTGGRRVEDDLRMIRDAGCVVSGSRHS
ncbi:MAG: biotin synthase BioB [Victivallales bacterium]|nr:biotin synthase BioB [Victivallales bacterium]